MSRVIEFENVVLEYPDEILDLKPLESIDSNQGEEQVLRESRTTKLSREEILRRLEETTNLHL